MDYYNELYNIVERLMVKLSLIHIEWNAIYTFVTSGKVQLVATICTVLPVGISFFSKIIKLDRKKMIFRTNELVLEKNKNFQNDNIHIEYLKKEYRNLIITNIAVWNKGTVIIRNDHSQFIELSDNCGNLFVDVNVIYCDNEVNINNDENGVRIFFNYLRPKEGFVLQIIQNCSYNDLSIKSNLYDTKLYNNSDHKIRHFIFFILAIIMLLIVSVLCCTILEALVEHPVNKISLAYYLVTTMMIALSITGFRSFVSLFTEGIPEKIFDVLLFKTKNLLFGNEAKKIEVIRLRNTSQNEFIYKKIYKRRKINKEKCFVAYGKNKEVVEVYTVNDVLTYKRSRLKSGDDKVRVKLIKADKSIRKKYLGKSVKYNIPSLLDKIKMVINKI